MKKETNKKTKRETRDNCQPLHNNKEIAKILKILRQVI